MFLCLIYYIQWRMFLSIPIFPFHSIKEYIVNTQCQIRPCSICVLSPNVCNHLREEVKENPCRNVDTTRQPRCCSFHSVGLTVRLTSCAKIGRLPHSSQCNAALVGVKHWQEERQEAGVVGGCCTRCIGARLINISAK